jgi:HTH-type transcriptional regulator/antitoxin HigA
MEGVAMLTSEVQKAAKIWSSISEILFVPHTNQEYQAMVRLLDNLIDEVGEDEKHPLASLMEIVGVLIEKYEDEHVPELGEE